MTTLKKSSSRSPQAPKSFTQIVAGVYGEKGDRSHMIYGLTAAGKVYKFLAYEGWIELQKKER